VGLVADGLDRLRAEAAGKPEDAVMWFAASIRIDSGTAVGRRALVGYGDAKLRLGDTAAGAQAFQAVASDPVQSDSTSQMAWATTRSRTTTKIRMGSSRPVTASAELMGEALPWDATSTWRPALNMG